MKTNNVKRINIKVPAIIMGALSAVCFAVGAIYACFGGGSFAAESSMKLTVSSIEDIVNRGKNIANDKVELADDIYVKEADFCVGEGTAFSGVFDGRGHTVYLNYRSGDLNTSFFSSIAKEGVVKNTRFVLTDVYVEGQAYSGVAKINYGTVRDCAVEYNLHVDEKEGMFTPFIAVNCGTVKSIVTSGTLVYADGTDYSDFISGSIHSTQKNDDEKKIAFAGASVYNYGELKNVISSPRYIGFYCTNRDNYLAGRCENVAIASVCAFSGGEAVDGKVPTESGMVSISEKTLYTSDDVRLDKFESFSSLIFDVNGALIKTVIENTYDFNNTVWEIDEQALCLRLKKA